MWQHLAHDLQYAIARRGIAPLADAIAEHTYFQLPPSPFYYDVVLTVRKIRSQGIVAPGVLLSHKKLKLF